MTKPTGIVFNGYRAGEIHATEYKPEAKDGGHSIVKVETWWRGGAFVLRTRYTCECGAKRSGYGSRAMYAIQAHQKVARIVN
jgi:hypothetical protein